MDEKKLEENLIVNLTFDFAVDIVEYSELLQREKHFVISNQLIKSGTSIGANVREAQNAESNNDFIHKMKVAAKEADESQYWLELCKKSKNYSSPDHLLTKLISIMRVLNKIISTSKSKTN
ncbi:MAG TPA: four helix bundle protein [Bacteroidia bacterium]|nr:four helix bundle protein [Bacteroidia bacterium]